MDTPTLPDEPTEAEPVGAGIGHNSGTKPLPYDPVILAEVTKTADAFIGASDVWKKQEVTSKELAEQLTDQIAGLRTNRKEADNIRKAQKKPHDDAGKAVQAKFTPILARYDKALEILLPKQAAWLDAEEKRLAAEKEAEIAAARQKEEEARLKALEAENGGSIDAQLEAEAAQKEAARAAKAAAKPVRAQARSASGAGRTVSRRIRKGVEITNIRHLFMHFQDHPKVSELLASLAAAEANSAGFDKEIPGTKITEIRSVA